MLLRARPNTRKILHGAWRRTFKHWALMAAVLIFSTIIVGPQIREFVDQSIQKPRSEDTAMSREQVGNVLQPHYTTSTEAGERFSLRAERATNTSSQAVDFIHITGELTPHDQASFVLIAPHGQLNTDQKDVTLSGGVRLRQADGYDLQTTQSRINLDRGEIIGETPLHGTTPFGNVACGAFTIQARSRTLKLTGKARLDIISPPPAKPVHGS